MPSNSDLWQRIQGFEIDNPSVEFPFSSRLARENGWSREKALEAIGEYKKFIYLICVSPSPLTPSEVVDQVWHLHLVYTRSYWKDFCEGVLGRPIHHDPTKGGEAQMRLFHGQYAQTLALYECEFGHTPQAQIWPPVRERFAAEPSRWPTGFGHVFLTVAAALAALLVTGGDLAAEQQSGTAGGGFLGSLLVIGAVAALLGLASLVVRWTKKDHSGEDGTSDGRGWWHDVGCGGGCGGCGG